MNPLAQPDLSRESPNASPWPWAILALVVCLIAISSQSLWIDEAFMAGKASQPTFADWWHMMPKGGGSDLQMPFYMFYMWAFAKIFGLGEWALRAANIPWFIAGVAAFIPAFPKKQRLAAAAVTLLCPFAWFYLNEARPYAMQLGASLVIFAAIYRLSSEATLSPRYEQNWITFFWLAIIMLCGSSLLGVLWAGAAFLSLLLLFPLKRLMQLLRVHWLACLLSCIVLATLAGYYIWTIKFGTRGLDSADKPNGSAALTAVKSAAHFRQGFVGGTELQNLAYLFYELLGFTGLGPGKLEIRVAGPHAFRHFAPQLLAYALALFCIFLLALPRLFRAPGIAKKTCLAFAILLPMLLLVGAGYFLGFLVLARHCTPLLPALFFLLSVGLVSACSSRRAVLRFAAGVFIVLSVCSCLSLRFAARHAKDDYRAAAQAANAALGRGENVWWSASDDGAAYYHLPLAAAPEQGRAVLVLNPTPQSLSARPVPDLIISSKPDLYDNQKALEKYVRENPYTQTSTFPAFAVWQRKSGQTNH